MEPDLVLLGRLVAAALLGPDVDDRRPRQCQGRVQRLEQGVEVMTRHDPDVGQAQVLEQLARLGEAHDRRAQPARQLEQVGPDQGDALDRAVVGALAPMPRA